MGAHKTYRSIREKQLKNIEVKQVEEDFLELFHQMITIQELLITYSKQEVEPRTTIEKIKEVVINSLEDED